jgi:hypothetical protein
MSPLNLVPPVAANGDVVSGGLAPAWPSPADALPGASDAQVFAGLMAPSLTKSDDDDSDED